MLTHITKIIKRVYGSAQVYKLFAIILITHISYGLLVEQFFAKSESDLTWVISFVESSSSLVFSLLIKLFHTMRAPKTQTEDTTKTNQESEESPKNSSTSVVFLYILLGVLHTAAKVLHLMALQQGVSYLVSTIIRSCKAAAVCLVTVAFSRKLPSRSKLFAVVVMSFGLIIFAVGQPPRTNSSDNTVVGVTMLLVVLLVNGLSAVVQDLIVTTSTPAPSTITMSVNICIASLSLIIGLFVNARAFLAVFGHTGAELMGQAVLRTLGELPIHAAVKQWGSLAVALLTTFRKACSILASAVIFKHSMTVLSAVGIAICLLGSVLVVIKRKPVEEVIEEKVKQE
eukprot:gnl/Dysnectes_brevis/1451_a1642_3156.p1 GENE.gnl/Dysnectes_brevis/1451_a1642_3156~~gnl/Dysnectes_brevis/1451_a1642_3156.p1  ORF type:complete len:342 (+),score=105.18 gnl/Dysnectes_brevis/1451_a1642_3156:45-1070(+)